MTDIRYSSASDPKWVAMVHATRVLIVARNTDSARRAQLWGSLHDPAGVQAVLDALTTGGISSTPSFALIDLPKEFGRHPSSISLIVRGPIKLSVGTAADTVVVDGEGVSTWVERTVDGGGVVEFGAVPSAVGSGAGAEEFVLCDGSAAVVWLSLGTSVTTVSAVEEPLVPATQEMVAPLLPVLSTDGAGAVADRPLDPSATITTAPPSDPPALDADDPSAAGGYDFLFGETVKRTVEDAAVRTDTVDAPKQAGDHDGRTAIGLTAAERKAARQARQKPPAPAPVAKFVLDFSTGIEELLEGTIIVGRAPSASKVSVNSVPRLVTVGGPDQDISRNHVQVSLEGGTVTVTDLHSRNGTLVTLPGRPPQQLRGGQPTAVISGTVVDLGSGVTITVREP